MLPENLQLSDLQKKVNSFTDTLDSPDKAVKLTELLGPSLALVEDHSIREAEYVIRKTENYFKELEQRSGEIKFTDVRPPTETE